MKTVISNIKAIKKMNTNKAVNRVFDDLDSYRNFCREFGYKFNEADLYRHGTPYSQYSRYRRGEPVRDNWEIDAAAFVDASFSSANISNKL